MILQAKSTGMNCELWYDVFILSFVCLILKDSGDQQH